MEGSCCCVDTDISASGRNKEFLLLTKLPTKTQISTRTALALVFRKRMTRKTEILVCSLFSLPELRLEHPLSLLGIVSESSCGGWGGAHRAWPNLLLSTGWNIKSYTGTLCRSWEIASIVTNSSIIKIKNSCREEIMDTALSLQDMEGHLRFSEVRNCKLWADL